MISKTLLPLLAGTVLAAAAHAQYNQQICSNAVISGTYEVACSGFVTPAGSPAAVPITMLGTAVADESGNWNGATMTSVAGTVFPQTSAGQANTKADCTGTITYNKGKADEINITYVITGNGDRLRGMSVDKGANLSCTLTRMRR
jgi:hypothetical protein